MKGANTIEEEDPNSAAALLRRESDRERTEGRRWQSKAVGAARVCRKTDRRLAVALGYDTIAIVDKPNGQIWKFIFLYFCFRADSNI